MRVAGADSEPVRLNLSSTRALSWCRQLIGSSAAVICGRCQAEGISGPTYQSCTQMEETRMNEQHDPEYWKRIARLALKRARNAGLSYDDAEDCALEFQVMVLIDGEGMEDLDAPGALDQLRRRLWWHVKTCVHTRNKANQGLVYLAQLEEAAAAGFAREPVSPDRRPEELAIERVELDAIRRIVAALPERKRWLLRRVEVDNARIVDLEAECGRTAGAIYKDLHLIRRLVRERLSAFDIADDDSAG